LKPTVLLTKKATRAALLARIRAATKALTSDDLFFLSFSDHGGQVNDGTRSSSKANAGFHAKIKAGIPASKTPNLFVLRPAAAFLRQRPFTL
ncbi:MAG: hypothetical protein B7Z52_03940, partial [Burkholderiales bacterium 12-64-5]